MKINFIGKTTLGQKALLDWSIDYPKEYTLINSNPVIIQERYKKGAIEWMIQNTAKRLKLPIETITKNETYYRSLCNKLKKKAIKNLNVKKNDIDVEVIEDEY